MNELLKALQQLLADPESQAQIGAAVARAFGPLIQPARLEAFDRFIAKAEREFPAISVAVTNAKQVPICERNPARIRLLIANMDAAGIVFIGHAQVSVGAQPGDPNAGFPIFPKTMLVIDAATTPLYAIASIAGPVDLRVADLVY